MQYRYCRLPAIQNVVSAHADNLVYPTLRLYRYSTKQYSICQSPNTETRQSIFMGCCCLWCFSYQRQSQCVETSGPLTFDEERPFLVSRPMDPTVCPNLKSDVTLLFRDDGHLGINGLNVLHLPTRMKANKKEEQ